MITLPIKDFNIELDTSADAWYGNITDDKIRSSLFDSDCWGNVDNNTHYCILTFDDIKEDYESFAHLPAEEKIDIFGEDYPPVNYTVYDWIRDCMMSSMSVVKSITRKE